MRILRRVEGSVLWLLEENDTAISNLRAAVLNAIGLPELVTGSLAHYEELAVQLAQDPVQLAGIAQRLKDDRLTAPLFDTDSFTRHLQQAYSDMYERYQADAALEDIYISC